jgi:DNA-binding protein HU-beta
MNKADLAARIADSTGLPKSTAEVAVGTLFSALTDALASGETVAIAGFGNFTVKARDARKGRNPQTGAEIDIPASNVPGFKAGKALKDAVNA